MKLEDIINQPRCLKCSGKYHESVFRSYHILDKVMQWCEMKVPHEAIIEWVRFLMTTPETEEEKQEDAA